MKSLRREDIESRGPVHLPLVMDIKAETILPYMKPDALPCSFLPDHPHFLNFKSESSINAVQDEGDVDEVDEGDDGYESDESYVTPHEVNGYESDGSYLIADDSKTFDEEDDTLLDNRKTSRSTEDLQVTHSRSLRGATPAPSRLRTTRQDS